MKNLMILSVVFCLSAGTAYAADSPPDREKLRQELEQARKELSEAARQVASLTRQLGEGFAYRFAHEFTGSDRAMLGVTIGGTSEGGKTEGVKVMGVTPGGPGAEAGIKSGDVLLAVNGKSLAADNQEQAATRLTEMFDDVKVGDTVTVRYRRDGKEQEVKVVTDNIMPMPFAWHSGGHDPDIKIPEPPMAPMPFFRHFTHRWGNMELVSLTPELGEYFGAKEGVLVVRAPRDEILKLKDGDIILKIDGRVPNSPVHAMRILRSYGAGETLELEIMRQKKRQTLKVEVPEDDAAAMRFIMPMPPIVAEEVRKLRRVN